MKPLFRGNSDVETLKLVVASEIVAPSTTAPDVSPALDAVAVKALARDPKQRFQDARAFADALEAAIDASGGPASHRKVGDCVAQIAGPVLSKRREALRCATEADERANDPPSPYEATVPARVETATMAAPEIQTLGGQVSGGTPGASKETRREGASPADGRPTEPHAPETARGWRSRRTVLAAAIVAVAAAVTIGVNLDRRVQSPVPSADVAVRECASHAACVDRFGGRAAVCRAADGKCALVESEDCRALAEPDDVRDEGTIWLGAMFPETGPRALNGKTDVQAAELARRDFAQALGTYRSTMFGLRRVALAMCDDAKDPERAAHHLVDDVGVPAIFGFGSSATLLDLSGSLLVPRGVLAIATMPTTPQVTRVPQPPGRPRLIWRTTYSLTLMAQAMARVVPDLLEKPARGKDEHLRVALLRGKSGASDAFTADLFKELNFNGKSALDNAADYREISVAAGADAGATGAAAKELVAFGPHVVIYFGGTPAENASVMETVSLVEKAWTGARRPRYLGAGPFPSRLLDVVGTQAELRKRFLSLTLVSTTQVNARFVLHYNDTFEDKISRASAPNTSYDAFYLLAYAIYTRGANEPITGESLAAAFQRLIPPGAPVDATPTSILDGVTRIRRGESIDVQGATGKLDFDLRSGEALSDVAVLCVDVDSGGRAVGSIESGVVYDVTTKRLEGTLRCP
jgi:ABC-type branched-subunit amino acid transport system substrate-binding protein